MSSPTVPSRELEGIMRQLPQCLIARYSYVPGRNRDYALPPTFRNTSVDLRMTSAILSGKNMAVLLTIRALLQQGKLH